MELTKETKKIEHIEYKCKVIYTPLSDSDRKLLDRDRFSEFFLGIIPSGKLYFSIKEEKYFIGYIHMMPNQCSLACIRLDFEVIEKINEEYGIKYEKIISLIISRIKSLIYTRFICIPPKDINHQIKEAFNDKKLLELEGEKILIYGKT